MPKTSPKSEATGRDRHSKTPSGVVGTGTTIELPENSRIVQPSYLEKNTGKKDLVRRLRNLVHVLRDDDENEVVVEVDSPEWPGLNATANLLVTSTYLHHADKDVRLYTVLACIEVLTIYAPDVPWEEHEIIDIFSQLTRQLANLANIAENDPTIPHYIHMLEVLANVRIGCILVDLVNQHSDQTVLLTHEDEDDDDEDSDRMHPLRKKNTPILSSMDALVDLLSTLLQSVRREHPAEILSLVPQAISACLCDYHPAQGGIPFPIPILDVLLKCIGQGPTQLIIAPATSSSTHTNAGKGAKARGKNTPPPSSATIQQLEVPNPTYQVAAQVIRSLLNRIAQPISQLLNGLLNGEPFYTDQSSIRCILAVNASDMEMDPPDSAKKSKNGGKNSTTTSAITKKFQVDWKNDENNEVYTIAYEFHRVAPQVLATVVGTIVHGLRSTSTIQRYGVTQFFGQLFSVQCAKYASDYASCFRDWLMRKNDIVPSIRICVVQLCMSILQATTTSTTPVPKEESSIVDVGAIQQRFDVALSVTETLANLSSTDLSLDVRLEAIHLICDWIYQRPKVKHTSSAQLKENGLILMLLQAVASRVSSKQKQERRDAVTGLAHIYCKHFVQPNLQPVVNACVSAEKSFDKEDEIDEDIIAVSVQALHDMCDDSEIGAPVHRSRGRSKSIGHRHSNTDDENSSVFERGCTDANTMDLYRWIPSKVLECVCFTDAIDTEMRSRIVQIMDEMLLKESSTTDKNSKQTDKSTSFAISRAIGWISVLHSLVAETNGDPQSSIDLLQMTTKTYYRYTSTAFKFLQQLLTQRATLQITASRYIDARAQIREYDSGTEEAMEADARAIQILEQLAKMTAPTDNPKVSMDDILTSFHGARDKHIFRILATIVDPAHTSEARRRALDELPKRTKALGDAVSDWVKNLVRRCAMGDSLNVDVVHACVRLAQGCARDNDISACATFLSLVKMTVDIYPAICVPKIFDVVLDLFSYCRSTTGSYKKDIVNSGVVTTLTSILSVVATTKRGHSLTENDDRLRELELQLSYLCTRDGTPDQAKNAVYTLAYICYPANQGITQISIDDYFAPLLKALTSTSRLKILADSSEGVKVVRALSALSALADCSPTTLAAHGGSQTIVSFALDGILLGRDDLDKTIEDSDNDNDDDSSQSPSPKKKYRSSTTKNGTPHFKGCLLENENLSASCRRLCAAADFLVSHIRSTYLRQVMQTNIKASTGAIHLPTKEQVRRFFQIMFQILRDQGLPASSRDRKMCSSRQDRAALRQCAAISLLRLCDARLGLEQEMLSKSMWHTLGLSLLDEERTVRIAVMEELSALYKGSDTFGLYMNLPPKAPSLRFLSYIVLCSDGDRDQDSTNGHAANVGKVVSSTRAAANGCVINLRKVSEATYTHCCAMGKDSETRFENHIKMLVTPEYCVPFAFHLLSHRKETPSNSALATEDDSEDEADFVNDENTEHSTDGRMRTLRKRLKGFLDSLVHTLGDRANNISFLLRMTEILGRYYTPVELDGPGSSVNLRKSIDSNGDEICSKRNESKHRHQLEARLKTICSVSREILLSFVKSDINLSTYTGTIQLPASLFKRSDLGTVQFSKTERGFANKKNEKFPVEASNTPVLSPGLTQHASLKSPKAMAPSSAAKSDVRVTFSPVVQYQIGKTTKVALLRPSLVPKSSTPESEHGSGRRRSTRSASIQSTTSDSVDTLGTTPPMNLRTGTTADDLETSDDDIFASTIPPRSSENESFVGSDHRGKAKQDGLLGQNFTTSSSEPTPTITQTPSTDVSARGMSSQSSSSDNSNEISLTGSHSRKRRTHSVDKAKPTKAKRVEKNLPNAIGQKLGSKKVLPKRSDELDFDFDDENVPIERNQGRRTKGIETHSKILATKSRSNTRTTKLSASRRNK